VSECGPGNRITSKRLLGREPILPVKVTVTASGNGYLMIFCSPRIFSCVLAGLTAVCFTAAVSAQTLEQRSESAKVAAVALPDAPQPDQAPAPAPAQQPSSTPPASSASSASTGAAQNAPPALPQSTDKTREALAEEQLKQQQTQRLMGVIPNFNTSYVYGGERREQLQRDRRRCRSRLLRRWARFRPC
jgi:hypothetical protein